MVEVVAIKRRSRIDISAEILDAAMSGANKTQIVYNANLNFSIAKKYLEMLEKKELIRKEGDRYVTTEKGKTFHDLAMILKL
ncbi:winged helix-turn-helix domain-containing protein [Methanohalophilus portucalensis]|jgi:predicted transcriptional regulator|uniref:Predicted transcriptional regulator n=3 Tax=Methanohalophilus TaxID=2175 RepID=A0A1X7NG17_9EURY|nr:winged helix-turn-helix domain-containing protein [Methanohalophilus portucalensis]SDW93345.1 Predicted transcriptional regulator [Methanohalophilus halophilus]SMH36684.1 Predicted transcriptional regulator [Methanohalophilus portucalensis FDF-1]